MFSKAYFDELLKLTGDKGAKAMLQQHFDEVMLLDGSLMIQDIDTRDDYQKLSGQL